MHQEWQVADIVNTSENLMFLQGFEGWRHSRQLQDELLETLEAGLGVDEENLVTLRGSWLAGWLAAGHSWLAAGHKDPRV